MGDGGDFEEGGEEEDGGCGGVGTGGEGGEGCEDVGEGLGGGVLVGFCISFHVFYVARRMRGGGLHELGSDGREGGRRTSKDFPPLPISPLSPRTKSPEGDSSSSIRLVQSSFPVQTTTCSA